MIISHRYKFIFIKTHKTAGSSMEMALAPLCGPEDVVTPMESNARTEIPRNYHANTLLGRAYARSRLFRKCINRHSPLLGAWYYEHMPAWRVRELIGAQTWDGYYKFCFERNPWAKVVSYYNWKRLGQGRAMPSFEDYVLKKSHRLPTDARLYFEAGHCVVDEVLDYQNFQAGFARLCERLGVPYGGVMPREKTNITERPVDYRAYYNEQTKCKVAELFAREIDKMGYTF